MLVRFVAVAIIGVSLLMEGLYVADSFVHQVPVGKTHCALLTIPALLGVVILIRSRPVAEWLSDKLDI